ncbi:MAG: hypothetical protein M1569_02460 [Candidatus Marsarchaeota archaeon]|nr:hypothetical protein [Candidatus Marsarchaeota archaeon]MCL5413243.1 hypothetical protein [Candidatus Marsarchaeota archaeon]
MEVWTVAVIGSDSGLEKALPIAARLGKVLAKRKLNIVIGAGGGREGLPLHAARAAKADGGSVFGVSPWSSAREHRLKRKNKSDIFDFITYTGFGIKGRNVVLVRSADAVIMVGGAMGTLNEFSIAFDEGKIIGIVEGSGGTSDRIRGIAPLGRNKGARIVYSSNPSGLVDAVLKLLNKYGS